MTLKTTFLILLGGALTVTERLRADVAGARTIAADGGMRHADALGVTPELWVGDFDSTPHRLAETWRQVPRRTFPPEKDATDGELAVEMALARGAERLVLAGAIGGERHDHAQFHFLMACRLRAAGTPVMLTSGIEEATPLSPGEQSFDLPAGSLFSVIGFSAIEELSIEGARYPLSRFDVPFGSSRTISNVAEGRVTVTLGAGTALLLARPYDLTGA